MSWFSEPQPYDLGEDWLSIGPEDDNSWRRIPVILLVAICLWFWMAHGNNPTLPSGACRPVGQIYVDARSGQVFMCVGKSWEPR